MAYDAIKYIYKIDVTKMRLKENKRNSNSLLRESEISKIKDVVF